MRKMTMKLRDIELPLLFLNSEPSRSKVEERKLHFKRTGEFPKLIVREDTKRLLDGYASYVAAKELKQVNVKVTLLTPKESIDYFASNQHKYKSQTNVKKKNKFPGGHIR